MEGVVNIKLMKVFGRGSCTVDWIGEVFTGFEAQFSAKNVALALGGAFGLAILTLLRASFRKTIASRFRGVALFFQARKQLNRLYKGVSGDGLWKTEPVQRPKSYAEFFANSFPILTVANLKGGVGKTTTAVNLAAYFVAECNERVLLVDLDFQGSMSSMVLSTEHRVPAVDELSKASKLVSGGIAVSDLKGFATPVRHEQMKTGYAISAYYDLATIENQEMVHWLTGKTREDIRYRLANILHQPEDRRPFDRVIIDAPPRLTTGTIQALCASTHVLIPTILDPLSGEAVGSFVREILDRQKQLWPYLKFAGISGQMVSANISKWRDEHADEDVDDNDVLRKLLSSERAGLAHINTVLKNLKVTYPNMPRVGLLPPDTFIAKRAPIAESAGTSVAFFDINNELKAMFRKLGREVKIRMEPDEIY